MRSFNLVCCSLASLLPFGAISLLGPQSALAVVIDWSPVGDPGNGPDPAPNRGGAYGAVGYAYNIGTYDVTYSQYAEFLNAKDPFGTNTLGLYNDSMRNADYRGVSFTSGNPAGSKYTVISGRENKPATYVTWYDAIRFANWMNNGQGAGDTETGAYTLGTLGAGGIPINGDSIMRNPGATVFLPSEDEWYKAAYYDTRTTAQGGPPSDSHYWIFPTSSDTVPTATVPTATPNSANYNNVVINLTDVGAYTGTTSPSGAFDMGGNVWQWNEALIPDLPFRGLGGGSFVNDFITLRSFSRGRNTPTDEGLIGFRLASIPEPSGLVLAALGLVGLAAWGRRRKRRPITF